MTRSTSQYAHHCTTSEWRSYYIKKTVLISWWLQFRWRWWLVGFWLHRFHLFTCGGLSIHCRMPPGPKCPTTKRFIMGRRTPCMIAAHPYTAFSYFLSQIIYNFSFISNFMVSRITKNQIKFNIYLILLEFKLFSMN